MSLLSPSSHPWRKAADISSHCASCGKNRSDLRKEAEKRGRKSIPKFRRGMCELCYFKVYMQSNKRSGEGFGNA